MPRFIEIAPDIFQWSDPWNVHVLRDGAAALLIDLGDGSVLGARGGIGVRKAEWILFTHHHREQGQRTATNHPQREEPGRRREAVDGPVAAAENRSAVPNADRFGRFLFQSPPMHSPTATNNNI